MRQGIVDVAMEVHFERGWELEEVARKGKIVKKVDIPDMNMTEKLKDTIFLSFHI